MSDLRAIDEALINLRHLWTGPPRLRDPQMGTVDLSTVWVVDGLARAPHKEHTVSDLAERMGVAHSTASRLVARAEQAGAVTRSLSPSDQRVVVVTLTAAGKTLAEAGLNFRLAALQRATDDWTPQERACFAALLARFSASMTARRKENA